MKKYKLKKEVKQIMAFLVFLVIEFIIYQFLNNYTITDTRSENIATLGWCVLLLVDPLLLVLIAE